MKRRRIGFVLLLLVLFLPVTVSAEKVETMVNIKGYPISYEYEVRNIKGNTFVPLRLVGESFGFNFEYIPKGKAIVIRKGDKRLDLNIDSKKAKVDGKAIDLPIAPYVKKGVTYVPTRFIAENLSIPLTWDGKNKFVNIGEKEVKLIENSKTVKFSNGKYAIDIPKEIEDKVIVREEGKYINILEKSNSELWPDSWFGIVFTIFIDNDHVRSGMAENERFFYYNNKNHTYLSVAGTTDVQFDDKSKIRMKNYKEVKSYEDAMVNSIRRIDK